MAFPLTASSMSQKELEPGVRATASQVQQKTEELSTLGLAFFLDNGSRRERPSADKHRGGMWEVASKCLKYVSASVTKVHSDARNGRALAVPRCQSAVQLRARRLWIAHWYEVERKRVSQEVYHCEQWDTCATSQIVGTVCALRFAELLLLSKSPFLLLQVHMLS